MRRAHSIPLLPTQLTLGNAVCGFGSLTLAAQAGAHYTADKELFYAGFLILAAMIFDVLDGHVARVLGQTSRFGGQLDSLCDVVSFGLAPAFLVLHAPTSHDPGWLLIASGLYVICVIVRLARFNSKLADDDSHPYFFGLPAPAAAGMIASLVVSTPTLIQISQSSRWPLARELAESLLATAQLNLPLVTVALSVLMVSRIRYPHPKQWIQGRRELHDLVQLAFFVFAACAIHELTLILVFLFFVVGSPVRAAWMNPIVREARRIPGRTHRPRDRAEWPEAADPPRHNARRSRRRRSRRDAVRQKMKNTAGTSDGYAREAFPRK